MAPLYAFITVAQLDGKIGPRALPPYVKLALAYLSESLPLRRHLPCRPRGRVTSAALRVDAHASPEGVGIGAWLPNVHPDGSLDTQSSRWLAFSVTPDNTPWAFGTEGESFRRIAALEALAVLIAIKHLLPQEPYDQVQQTVQLTEVLTDNRGNKGFLPPPAIGSEGGLVQTTELVNCCADSATSPVGGSMDIPLCATDVTRGGAYPRVDCGKGKTASSG